MNLQSRIERLEGASLGMCACPDSQRIAFSNYREAWHREPPNPGPVMCPRCGRLRETITVTYTDDWRTTYDTGA